MSHPASIDLSAMWRETAAGPQAEASNHTIRNATADDAEKISALICEVGVHGHEITAQVKWWINDCFSPEAIRTAIADGTHKYLVATGQDSEAGDEQVIGAVRLNVRSHYLGGLHTRNHTLGSELVTAAVDLSDELGIPQLTASFWRTDTRYAELMVEAGFRAAGRDNGYLNRIYTRERADVEGAGAVKV